MDRYSNRSRSRGRSLLACAIVSLLSVLLLLGSQPTRADVPGNLALAAVPSRPVSGLPDDGVGYGRGYVPPPFDTSHLDGNWRRSSDVSDLASRWDWREQGAVTRVQNQGSCGACYAFATLASFESQLLIQGQGLYDFSENNLAECNYQQTGCEGGNVWITANQLSTYGAATEACDPWNPADQPCNTGCPPVLVGTDVWVLGGNQVPPTDILKGWLRDYGPLFVSMDSGTSGSPWGQEFGTYNGSYTLYKPMASPDLNHAVLLVGWDDGLTHGGGTGAWIVKNSWGTGWGGTCAYGNERGFFTIAYGSAGLGTNAAVVRGWDAPQPGGRLLYHDEAGAKNALACGNNLNHWGLARLTPPEGGCATQVEIWTLDETTDVDVYIYDSFDGSAPSGLLWKRENLSFAYAGYHTISIDPPLPLQAGNDVNVEVKFGNAQDGAVVVDDMGPVSANQSYLSCTGADGNWTDLSTFGSGVDIGIRLRMGSCATTPTASPTSTRTPTPTASPTPSQTGMPTATYTPRPPTQTPTFGPSPTRMRVSLPIIMKTWLVLPPPTSKPTFSPVCTPPPCDGVLWCPTGDCPGGCGVVCATLTATATKWGTPTGTPTPTPPPTDVTIRGRVTFRGTGIGGIMLALRYYNGAGWSTRATTATLGDGTYQFPPVPLLMAGQRYYVRYLNGDEGNADNPAYLSFWYSFPITVTPPGFMGGGDWDIDDIVLVSPNPGASVSLPQDFLWMRRPATPWDSYALGVLDPVGHFYAETDPLGYVAGITLLGLPPELAAGTPYLWYVAVYAPDGGDGASYGARWITFTNTGAPDVTSLARPAPLGREGSLPRVRVDAPLR